MRTLLSTAFTALALCTAVAYAAEPGSQPGVPLTVAAVPLEKPASAVPQATAIPVAGAECPTGSGSYCSDELPYCCPGVSTSAYCAKDVNGCTK